MDAVTNIAQTGAPDEAYEALRAHFSEEEMTKITVAIGTINVWNRLAVGFRSQHPIDKPAQAAWSRATSGERSSQRGAAAATQVHAATIAYGDVAVGAWLIVRNRFRTTRADHRAEYDVRGRHCKAAASTTRSKASCTSPARQPNRSCR